MSDEVKVEPVAEKEEVQLGAGVVMSGQYKRANRESVEAVVEVTDLLVLPTGRANVAYLFGTRVTTVYPR